MNPHTEAIYVSSLEMLSVGIKNKLIHTSKHTFCAFYLHFICWMFSGQIRLN